MSPRALTFVITDLESGRRLGHALVCPDARYASIAWKGVEQLERRFVEPADWRMLGGALSVGLANGPLPADHAMCGCCSMLAGGVDSSCST